MAIDPYRLYAQLREAGSTIATVFTNALGDLNKWYEQFNTENVQESDEDAEETQDKETKERDYEKISIIKGCYNEFMNPYKINIALLMMRDKKDGPFVNSLSIDGFPEYIASYTVMKSIYEEFDQFSFFFYEYDPKENPKSMEVDAVFKFTPYLGSFLFKKNRSLFEAFENTEHSKPTHKLANYSSETSMIEAEIKRIFNLADKARPNLERVLVIRLKKCNITLRQHAEMDGIKPATPQEPICNPIISRKSAKADPSTKRS